jgi:hypothetical protein
LSELAHLHNRVEIVKAGLECGAYPSGIDSYRLLAALGGGIIVVEGGGIDCIQQEKNDAGL